MKKRLLICIIVVFAVITSLNIYAAPYSNYTFNHKGDYFYEPPAMIPEVYYDWTKMIEGRPDAAQLRTKPFKNPQDFIVDKNGMVFIADSENNRVVILNDKFKLAGIIEEFDIIDKVTGLVTVSKSTFKYPLGMCFDSKGFLYVCDRDNSRIVVFSYSTDGTFNCDRILDKPDIDEIVTLNVTPVPVGTAAAETAAPAESTEAIATDTPDPNVTPNPDETPVPDSSAKPGEKPKFFYQPQHIAVDNTDRVYVLAKGINQGIIELDNTGKFNQFIASAKVSPSFLDLLWRKFYSEEQKQRINDLVPPEYNSLTIDKDGFIYGTLSAVYYTDVAAHINLGKNATEKGALIRRVDVAGVDVLRRKGNFPPAGDIIVNKANEKEGLYSQNVYSTMVDIEVFPSGIYSALDMKRNKVFTYDPDGNLLFVFGTSGIVLGSITQAAALQIMPDGEKMAILDAKIGQITIFKPTPYAELILEANRLQSNLEFDAANAKWNELLNISSNSEIGYVGKGKYEYNKGNYIAAMEYFQLGNDKISYSKALKQYRNIIIKRILPYVLGSALGLCLLWYLYRLYRKFANLGKGAKV